MPYCSHVQASIGTDSYRSAANFSRQSTKLRRRVGTTREGLGFLIIQLFPSLIPINFGLSFASHLQKYIPAVDKHTNSNYYLSHQSIIKVV